MRSAFIATLLAALFVAGCGSSKPAATQTQTTTTATHCFENALADASIKTTSSNCGDATSFDILNKASQGRFSAQCTHKLGNEYICDVTGAGTQPIGLPGSAAMVKGGFYSVTFDGKSIVYQPSS